MGRRIELKGRKATAAATIVFALLLGNLFLPRVLAMTGLRTGYTYRLWNSGHSERHVGTDGGLFLGTSRSYELGKFVGWRGQRVHLDYEATVRGGKIAIYFWRYRWGWLPDSTGYMHHISRSGSQSLVISIPEDGIYSVYVSPMGFGGSVEFDWTVES